MGQLIGGVVADVSQVCASSATAARLHWFLVRVLARFLDMTETTRPRAIQFTRAILLIADHRAIWANLAHQLAGTGMRVRIALPLCALRP